MLLTQCHDEVMSNVVATQLKLVQNLPLLHGLRHNTENESEQHNIIMYLSLLVRLNSWYSFV